MLAYHPSPHSSIVITESSSAPVMQPSSQFFCIAVRRPSVNCVTILRAGPSCIGEDLDGSLQVLAPERVLHVCCRPIPAHQMLRCITIDAPVVAIIFEVMGAEKSALGTFRHKSLSWLA